MCPSLIEIGSKTAQTNRQTNIHYENNGHLAVNQKLKTKTKMLSRNGPVTKSVELVLTLEESLWWQYRPANLVAWLMTP